MCSFRFVVPLIVVLASAVVCAQSSPSPSQGGPTAQQPSQGGSAQPPSPGSGSARDLANQVNNPAAPVTLLQFRDVLLPNVGGADGATNEFQIQPVIPMGPFASLPILQLMKLTIPFPSLPSPVGVAGMGDVQLFDLVSIKESWGRWGFGPALVFPTASDKALGQGKWQAGPAVALIYTRVKNLTAGAVWQNPISFAGSADRPDVNNLIITPTLTYNLEDGWFAGLSDFDWEFDWENGGAATVLLGVQVGKTRQNRPPERQPLVRGRRRCGKAIHDSQPRLDSGLRVHTHLQRTHPVTRHCRIRLKPRAPPIA